MTKNKGQNQACRSCKLWLWNSFSPVWEINVNGALLTVNHVTLMEQTLFSQALLLESMDVFKVMVMTVAMACWKCCTFQLVLVFLIGKIKGLLQWRQMCHHSCLHIDWVSLLSTHVMNNRKLFIMCGFGRELGDAEVKWTSRLCIIQFNSILFTYCSANSHQNLSHDTYHMEPVCADR